MKVLSLFSGVGGFDMGLENAGMQTVFQCEWDKHCRTILDRHWPTVPKWDDVSTLTGEHILAHAPVIDVVAWGSPCQDLSVAGKRAGLEGGRSGLFYEGIRIINELRKASNGQYPRISIWENVYGALNSNKGDDFEAILKEMVEAGSLLCEWRVLDAQYFGVPQRRRRVFVVAVFDSATAARCPDPLLPVSEGLRWNPTTRTTTREESADTTSASIGSGSRMRGFGDYISDNTASAIKARDHKDATDLVVEPSVVVGTLTVSDLTKQVNNEIISKGLLQVVEPFTGTSHAQYGEGVGTLRANGGDLGGGSETLLLDGTRVNDVRVYEPPVQTLKERMGTGGNNVPMLMFDTQFGSNANVFENQSPTLKASQAAPSVAYPIQDGRDIEKNQNGLGVAEEGAPAYTIDQTGAQAVAYPIHSQAVSSGGNSRPNSDGRGNGLGIGKEGDPSTAVVGTTPPAVAAGTATMVVRRLTPLECERLMGWPDDHTRYKADGTEQADTHRYKQCGNGVASPVAQWIGEQLINL